MMRRLMFAVEMMWHLCFEMDVYRAIIVDFICTFHTMQSTARCFILII